MAEQKDKIDRIHKVVGLRTIAIVGVIWIHTWSAFGNPACMIGPIDVERAVAILGNGVDLFFVISGFCMYLLFAHQTSELTFQKYGQFMGKRWKRIAPAFYVAAIVGAFIFWNRNESFPFYDLAAHFFFMHIWLPTTGQLSPPFWSLATEWHFYLLLPLLIKSFQSRIGFWRTIWMVMGLSLFVRLGLYYFFLKKQISVC